MKRLLLILALFDLSTLNAQSSDQKAEKNLVPNGSFENYRRRSSDVRKAIPCLPIETIDY
jgi:hypothetical protein